MARSRKKAKSPTEWLDKPKDRALKALNEIAHLLQSTHSGKNPLGSIVTIIRQVLDVAVCSLYILTEEELVLVASSGLARSSIGVVHMPLNKGLTGLVAETLKPVIVKDAKSHPRFEYFPETKEERFESFAGVPLLSQEKLVGVLTIQTKDIKQFPDTTIDMLNIIAFQISSVIRNIANLEAIQKSKTKGKQRKAYRFQGQGVSPGFMIGPLVIYQSRFKTQITEKKDSDPPIEKKRLNQALEMASKDLEKLEKELLKKLSKKESDIFNAHQMILKDRGFRQKLFGEIEKKRSAEDSVLRVINDYVKTFSKIKDPYLKERSADLEDLAHRLLEHLSSQESDNPVAQIEGILLADQLSPSETAVMNPERIQGIITIRGGHTSHAAILARSLGIPAVMGISEEIIHNALPGDLVIIDGKSGNVFINPPADVLEEYKKTQKDYANRLVRLNTLSDQPACTKDGRRVHLDANVGLMNALQYLRYYGAEGVGLYRTEFPFMVRDSLPSEDQQYHVYRKIIESADGLPVTFRTLDAGGDKPISYLHLSNDNSFLGYRSIRLCLAQPRILKTQLKALFRAAAHGPMRILFPMISGVEEIREVKQIMREVKRDIAKRKSRNQIGKASIGIMIEVPSAVHLAHNLIKDVDFFSIGTNDLIQYLLAVDRNNERVSNFFEPYHPAVINALWRVVQIVHQAGKEVSICGEMAGDPLMVPLLVGLGFDRLSMIPTNIPLVKKVIMEMQYRHLLKDVRKVLDLPTAKEIKKRLSRHQTKIDS